MANFGGVHNPEHMPWLKHYNDGSEALNRHDYDDAISQTTMAVEAFQSMQYVAILDVRAEAYGNKGDYERALEDAREMIHYAPHSPLGYLRAGDLYTMQSNYGEAIDIYAFGLYSVEPSSLPEQQQQQYELILRKKQEAEQKQYQRLDLMRVLPFDVISIILQELTLEEWMACMDVCVQWRELVPRCLACRHLDIMFWGCDKRQDEHVTRLMGSHIQSIALANVTSFNATRSAIEVIMNRCQSIRSLEFQMCQITMDDVWPALRRVGYHLTNLRINVAPSSDVTIDALLKLCPNVSSFTFHAPSPHSRTTVHSTTQSSAATNVSDSSLLSITYLSVDVSRYMLLIESLLCRCPKLRCLIIPFRPEDSRQLVTPEKVLDLCPDLEYFDLHASLPQDTYASPPEKNQKRQALFSTITSNTGSIIPTTINTTTTTGNRDNEEHHLRELYIADLHGYTGNDFMPVLERTRNHLERLHIGVGAGDVILMDEWSGLAGLQFSKLQSFHCSIACSTVFFSSMFRHCPVLVDLEFFNVAVIDDVFDAIVSAGSLQRLSFSYCHGITEAGFLQFIRHHATALQEIELTQCRAVGDDLLEAIAETNSRSLRILRLVDNPRVTPNGLLMLVQGLVRAPAAHLHTLVMKYMHSVTAMVLRAVRDLSSLKTLDISGSSSVTDNAIHMVVDQNPQLRHLTISNCTMITQSAIEHARESHVTHVVAE
ncbi:hypothetical protein BDB00DRAFT_930197 [Zychaea mexicana]|uniref:uncharacterized protein n=1 Tax=Zychaea mexicana TaxID=64656 RepID=UPI0022FDB48B|nr:uncharacterized protein BDB00DRAFT_930197 [Zychaea mexicana]KAI9491789.1 hypothetical protein BDB00DRAFT_930197 [Zychaea mexicana]